MMMRFSSETPSLCNSIIDSILFNKPSITLIYGPAASGKTNLVLQVIKCSKYMFKNVTSKKKIVFAFISTEGSQYLNRAFQLGLSTANILYAEAIDQDHLLSLILSIFSFLDTYIIPILIIDSINNHYRVEANTIDGLRKFVFVLSLLQSLWLTGVYIIVTAQVHTIPLFEFDLIEEPAGFQFLSKWAHNIIRIDYSSRSSRKLNILQPVRKTFYFTITKDGIEWL